MNGLMAACDTTSVERAPPCPALSLALPYSARPLRVVLCRVATRVGRSGQPGRAARLRGAKITHEQSRRSRARQSRAGQGRAQHLMITAIKLTADCVRTLLLTDTDQKGASEHGTR